MPEQNDRKLSEGIKAEDLNVLIGSDAVEDEDVKEAVKLNTLMLLQREVRHHRAGLHPRRDRDRARLQGPRRGLDRSMVGGYGHDDRVDAYPALMAEIETKNPAYTTVCVLTDKEEIGSDGVTGMQSMYVFHFMQQLCRAAGQDDILAFQNSVCLSADVTAAYDPTWANAFEPRTVPTQAAAWPSSSTPAAAARALPAMLPLSWWGYHPPDGCQRRCMADR